MIDLLLITIILLFWVSEPHILYHTVNQKYGEPIIKTAEQRQKRECNNKQTRLGDSWCTRSYYYYYYIIFRVSEPHILTIITVNQN